LLQGGSVSVTIDLASLGVVMPESSSARSVILGHICDLRISEDLRQRRIEEFIAAQKEWLGKKVHKTCEAGRFGTVMYIVPAINLSRYNRHARPTTIYSAYEAHVRWGSKHTTHAVGALTIVTEEVKKPSRRRNGRNPTP
jgi:hypothetical protein